MSNRKLKQFKKFLTDMLEFRQGFDSNIVLDSQIDVLKSILETFDMIFESVGSNSTKPKKKSELSKEGKV